MFVISEDCQKVGGSTAYNQCFLTVDFLVLFIKQHINGIPIAAYVFTYWFACAPVKVLFVTTFQQVIHFID